MKKLFGIPIVEDGRFASDEGAIFALQRRCDCAPAVLVKLVFSPRAGVQCACGAVWPLADEPEVG